MSKEKKKKDKVQYGIKKNDTFNWAIYSRRKIKVGRNKGQFKETSEAFYHSLEQALKSFIDFRVGRALVGEPLDEKKILKAIKSAKKEVLKEIQKLK